MADWTRAPKLSLYPRENEGQGRSYRNPFTGETYPSVTSLLKYEDKSSLTQWAVDRAVQWCVDNWQELSVDPDDAFKRARRRHDDVRDERAWVGSGIHAYIEAEHTGGWDFPELNDEQMVVLEWWKTFNSMYAVEPLLTEFTVFDEAGGYMGTADGLWRITDNITGESWVSLVDVKTSRRVWPGHYVQLAALASAGAMLVEVPEGTDGAQAQDWKNPVTGKKETAYWVLRDIPEFDKVQVLHLTAEGVALVDVDNVDIHFDKFVAYKKLYDADERLKKIGKEEK